MPTKNVISGVMGISGMLVILGAFLDWISVTAAFVGQLGRNGIEGGGDGIFTILLAGVTLATFVYAYRLPRWNWKIRSALIVLSAIICIISIVNMREVSDRIDFVNAESAGFGSASMGEGLILTLLGGLGMLGASLWGTFKWDSLQGHESTTGIRELGGDSSVERNARPERDSDTVRGAGPERQRCCTQCGAILQPEMRFCTACGAADPPY